MIEIDVNDEEDIVETLINFASIICKSKWNEQEFNSLIQNFNFNIEQKDAAFKVKKIILYHCLQMCIIYLSILPCGFINKDIFLVFNDIRTRKIICTLELND